MRKTEINKGEQVIRVASAVGNGAHVFVPREWLGEKIAVVRLEPRQKPEELILEKLKEYLPYIGGLYLVGSHARQEQTPDSDIDVLVITNKEIKVDNIKNLHIMPIVKDSITHFIKNHPVIMYSMLTEAKPILNVALLEELRSKYIPRKSHFKDYLEETESILNINKELLDDEGKSYELNESAYSVILRIRGIYLVKSLLQGRKYSNKALKSDILKKCNVDYDSIYAAYSAVKNERSDKILLKAEDLRKLISFAENEIKELRR